MNTFLISIGAAIIAALLAAFTVPVFIDWNSYRDRIEAEARRVLCRNVEIAGDLDVRLLPAPVVTTGHVEVIGGEDEVLVSAAGSTLKLSLGDLVLGGLEVTALELDRPVFTFTTDVDGIPNWAGNGTRPGVGQCDAEIADVNVRLISITNGIATLKSAGMDAPLTFEHLDANLTASGPTGPYKLSGAYGPAESRLGVTLSSGSVTAGASTRVSGRLAVDEHTEFSFDRMADGWTVPPHYIGAVKIEHVLSGAAETSLRLTGEARAEASRAAIELTELTLSAEENGSASSATGAARVDFSENPPNVVIDLKARRIDVGKLIGEAGGQTTGLADLVRQAGDWAGDWAGTGAGASSVTGRVSINVAGALYRDELVQDLNASFNLGAGSLAIDTLKAVLPGQSDFDFSGNLMRGSGGNQLLGDMVLNTRDLKRLVTWAVPPQHGQFAGILPETHSSLSVTGTLRGEAGNMEMTGIKGLIGGNSFSGDLSVTLAERGDIHADLIFDELNLDRLVPKDIEPLNVLNGRGIDDFKAPDLGLEIEARRVKWRGRDLRGLSGSGQLSANHLTLEALNIDDVAGGRIGGAGEVWFESGGPRGGIDFQVEADDLPAMAELLGVDLLRLSGRTSQWASLIRRGELSGRIESAKDGETWKTAANIEGVVEGTGVSATISSNNPPRSAASGRIAGAVKLHHVDAGHLFAQLGLKGLPASTSNAAADLTFDGVGSVEKGFGYSLTFAGFDAKAAAEGSIETAPARVRGELTVDAEDSNRIADLLGVGAHAPVLPATHMTFGYDLKGGVVDVNVVDGEIAGASISGRGQVRLSGKRSGEVDLELGALSLPWAMASLFANKSPAAISQSQGSEGIWSTDLINANVLDRWPLTLRLKTGSLQLAGDLVLGEAEIDAGFGDGRLGLTSLAGRLPNGGAFEASGEISRSDLSLTVDGHIRAQGFDLGPYLIGEDSRPLAMATADVDVKFKTGGRSLLSLASSLSGEGELSIGATQLARLDAARLLARVGRAGNIAAVEGMMRGGLDDKTTITMKPAPVSASNGRIKIGPAAISAEGLEGQATSFINLVGGRIDQEVLLSAGQGPRLAVIHSGAFDALVREIELTGLKSGTVHVRDTAEDGAAGNNLPAAQVFIKAPQTDTAAGNADAGDSPPQNTGQAAAPLPSQKPSGPPVGVIEEKVFELPLVGGN